MFFKDPEDRSDPFSKFMDGIHKLAADLNINITMIKAYMHSQNGVNMCVQDRLERLEERLDELEKQNAETRKL